MTESTLRCDWPGCRSAEGVWTLQKGHARPLKIDLCPYHQRAALQTVAMMVGPADFALLLSVLLSPRPSSVPGFLVLSPPAPAAEAPDGVSVVEGTVARVVFTGESLHG